MSKRFLSIIVILLILIITCVWEQVTIDKYLYNIYNQALAIQNYVKENADISKKEFENMIDTLDNSWKKEENILCFLANHKDIADMGTEITRLKTYQENKQYEELRTSISVIVHLSQAYHHIMGISIQNLI